MRTAVTCDGLAILVAAIIAWALRFGFQANGPTTGEIPYAIFTVLSIPLWLVVMAVTGCYDSRLVGCGDDEYRKVIAAGFYVLAAIAIIGLASHIDTARGLIAAFVPLGVLLTVTDRFALRKRLQQARERGECLERVVIAGERVSVEDLGRHLAANPWAGYTVTGVCSTEPAEPHAIDDGGMLQVFGGIDAVLAAVDDLQPDAVVITDASVYAPRALRQLSWDLKDRGVQLIVAPVVTDIAGPRISTRPVAGLPLLHVEEPRYSAAGRVYKAVFDPIFAALLLVLLGPLLVLIAIAVRLTSRGPALFRQERVGLNGEPFTVWKFRTMTRDAHRRKPLLLDRNDADGVLFKLHDDPRVTRVGRVLRRFSLDELPQLIQVVGGKMSLVGPRPPLPEEVASYEDHVHRRLLVKPGMTGLWQVNGRANLPWDEAVRLDLYYVDHWSPAMDAAILLKTLGVVIRGEGAY